MITVLILEDDDHKFSKIFEVLLTQGVLKEFIKRVSNAAHAEAHLVETLFDLLILDINVPLREGEDARRNGGEALLQSISKKADRINTPAYIVGITGYQDIKNEVSATFDNLQWHVLHYDQTSDDWENKLKTKVSHICAHKRDEIKSNRDKYKCDIAVLTALESPELTELRKLPLNWQTITDEDDTTIYHRGEIKKGSNTISIIAASSCFMGMPHATVTASKLILKYKPQYLWMLGICGGIEKDVQLGDIIVADSCWDYGSGKFKESDSGEITFEQAPHQYSIDRGIRSYMSLLTTEKDFTQKIKDTYSGKPPEHALSMHLGPMASGAAVISSAKYLAGIKKQNRKLLGLEMEAYGVMCAGENINKLKTKIIIAKSVCDFADAKKSDNFQEYAAYTSASFFYNFTKDYLF